MSKVQGIANQNLVWPCEYIKTRIKTAYHEAGQPRVLFGQSSFSEFGELSFKHG